MAGDPEFDPDSPNKDMLLSTPKAGFIHVSREDENLYSSVIRDLGLVRLAFASVVVCCCLLCLAEIKYWARLLSLCSVAPGARAV